MPARARCLRRWAMVREFEYAGAGTGVNVAMTQRPDGEL